MLFNHEVCWPGSQGGWRESGLLFHCLLWKTPGRQEMPGLLPAGLAGAFSSPPTTPAHLPAVPSRAWVPVSWAQPGSWHITLSLPVGTSLPAAPCAAPRPVVCPRDLGLGCVCGSPFSASDLGRDGTSSRKLSGSSCPGKGLSSANPPSPHSISVHGCPRSAWSLGSRLLCAGPQEAPQDTPSPALLLAIECLLLG